MSAKIIIPNLDNLIRRYFSGESVKELSDKTGISRHVIKRNFTDAGVSVRGRSAAELMKWSRMTKEQRAKQTAAANAASRGRVISFEEKCAQALGKERARSHIAPVENTFSTWLRDAGLNVAQQKAIGPYNVDIAMNFPSLAVEIFGGGWHTATRHKARHFKRVEYLINSGWDVLIVWIDARRYPLDISAVKYAIALHKKLSRNPTASRQYRVILGNGQVAPVCRSYLNNQPDIKRFYTGD